MTAQPPSPTPRHRPDPPRDRGDDPTAPPAPAPAKDLALTRDMTDVPPRDWAGALPEVPGYRVEKEIGRGGMGVVYLAHQLALNRKVALKMLRDSDLATADQLQRFFREAETVARLRHPNIVQVYEFGQHQGRPFVALEYVEGGSLAAQVPPAWAPREAARLVAALARAVHHAHEHDVIHRDLKPANVLLSADPGVRGSGQEASSHRSPRPGFHTPKITDFGLAKVQDSAADLTQSGAAVGTPAYMAPEQARGDSRHVGPAADVYALGAILYELLAGQPPFPHAHGYEAALLVLIAEPTAVTQVRRDLPRDLGTICMKCLEKEPARRYASAQDLADDLGRFLIGEPIQARRVSEAERALKWARRRPAVAGLLLAFLAALVLGTALSLTFAWLAGQRAEEADLARDRATQAEARAQTQVAQMLFDKALEQADRGQVAQGLHYLLRAHDEAPPDAADLRRQIRTNLAAWAGELHTLRHVLVHPDKVGGVDLSPDGRHVVTGTEDGGVRLWDVATGQPLGAPWAHGGWVRALAFSPDGRHVVTGTGDARGYRPDRRLAVWEVATGRRLAQAASPGGWVYAVRFTPDGHTVLAGSGGLNTASAGTILALDPAKLTPRQPPWPAGPAEVAGLDVSPDGRLLAAAARPDGHPDQGAVWLWDLATGQRRPDPIPHPGPLAFVAFHPDGTTLMSGAHDGRLRFWRAADGQPARPPVEYPAALHAGRFTPDGRAVVVGAQDGMARVWEVATARQIGQPLTHSDIITGVAVGADGATAVTAGEDQRALIWRLARPLSRPARLQDLAAPGPPAPGPAGPWQAGGYRPDGQRVIVFGGMGVAALKDTATNAPVGAPLRHQQPIMDARFSPDGTLVATAGSDGTARIWDAATGLPRTPPLRLPNFVRVVAWRPDGRVLATGDYGPQGRVTLWDAATGKPTGPPLVHPDIVFALDFRPDGKVLASGTTQDWSGQPAVYLWDLATGRQLCPPLPHRHNVTTVRFRPPNGRVLLTGSSSDGVRLWDGATGRPVGDFIPHPKGLGAVAFAPDGSTFLTGAGDGTAQLFDGLTGAPLPGGTFRHPAPVGLVAYGPDGLLLTGTGDGCAWVWQLTAGPDRSVRLLGPPVCHRGGLLNAAFLPDGSGYQTTGADGTTRRWPLPRPLPEADLPTWAQRLQVQTGWALDPGGTPRPLTAAAREAVIGRLRAAGAAPDQPLVPPPDPAAWHAARAADAEEDGDAFAARYHLDRLIRLRPDDWLARARRAHTWAQAGDFSQAGAAYAGAWEKAPAGAALTWYRHQAAAASAVGADARGRWYLDQAVAVRPDAADVLAERAALHTRAGRWAEAVADWTAALALQPEPWTWYAERALAHARLGRGALAEADIGRAIARGADANFLVQAADIRARAGRWADAAQLYARARDQGPMPPEIWRLWALATLRAGDQAGYQALCRRLLVGDPARFQGFGANLIFLIAAAGPDAVADWGPVLAIANRLQEGNDDVTRQAARTLRGAVLYRAGRLAEAREWLAPASNASTPVQWAFLAMVHARSGQADEARPWLERLRAWKPSRAPERFWEDLEVEVLRREAEAVVGKEGAAGPGPPGFFLVGVSLHPGLHPGLLMGRPYGAASTVLAL